LCCVVFGSVLCCEQAKHEEKNRNRESVRRSFGIIIIYLMYSCNVLSR